MLGDNTPVDIATPQEGGTGPDRSRQLIDAANELLAEGGLEGLTIRAMLKRTGLARRAFYERFAGKDDLVLAVFEETMLEAANLYRDEARQLSKPLEKIRMIVVGLVMGAIDNDDGFGELRVAAMVREHLRLAQTRPGELQAALQPLLDFFAELVTEGIRIGQLRDSDPVLQATLIYNLVATTLHTELMMKEAFGAGTARKERLADEIWEFCRRAIIA
jgi:AcrR family transcriptional regulator